MSDDKPRRKMAVILASDMVGFSKAMGVDETGTLKKLKEICEVLDVTSTKILPF